MSIERINSSRITPILNLQKSRDTLTTFFKRNSSSPRKTQKNSKKKIKPKSWKIAPIINISPKKEENFLITNQMKYNDKQNTASKTPRAFSNNSFRVIKNDPKLSYKLYNFPASVQKETRFFRAPTIKRSYSKISNESLDHSDQKNHISGIKKVLTSRINAKVISNKLKFIIKKLKNKETEKAAFQSDSFLINGWETEI